MITWASHQWRHKSWMSLRYLSYVHGVSNILHGEMRDMLFAVSACFAKQRGYGVRRFAKVHTSHHVLELMNTLHVQMTKVVVPKFKHIISIGDSTRLVASSLYTLTKSILYKTSLRDALTMASPSQDSTMHCLGSIEHLNNSIQVCLPRVSWYVTWAREAHI